MFKIKMHKIYWLTGESGAGKTTLAKEIIKHINAIHIDGDEMRESISQGLGFSREDRKENNLRIARLVKTLATQQKVIVSVIAPMEEVRKEINDICSPNWIYLKRNIPERPNHFYEEPENVFTVDIDTGSIGENTKKILDYIDKIEN